jgi:uncharacterized protein YbjT (DUF2867 family)
VPARPGTILVSGATGLQGGAVLRHLVACRFPVRVLVRDPESEQARLIGSADIEMIRGDLTDRDSLDRALDGVEGVFAMATPYEKGPEAEVAQGTTLGDAAKAAGVRHYVYSSVGAANRDSGIPHFQTKTRIEAHLRTLGLPLTILRPVFFYENFNRYAMQQVGDAYEIRMPMSPETRLQMMAADDVGSFVTLAFGQREEWVGRELEIAGDELTMAQIAETIQTYSHVHTDFVQVPAEEIRAYNEDAALMYAYFEREGYQADLLKLRRLLPELTAFAEWLEGGGLRRIARAA